MLRLPRHHLKSNLCTNHFLQGHRDTHVNQPGCGQVGPRIERPINIPGLVSLLRKSEEEHEGVES